MKSKDITLILIRGVILFLISAVAALLLAFTADYTRPYIEAHREKALRQAKIAVGGVYQKEVAVNGYVGKIQMLIGIGATGQVTGVKILRMQETPGLGTKAQEVNFLAQFIDKTIKDRLRAKEDIDAITGATITTQAVADGVREALYHHGQKTSENIQIKRFVQ